MLFPILFETDAAGDKVASFKALSDVAFVCFAKSDWSVIGRAIGVAVAVPLAISFAKVDSFSGSVSVDVIGLDGVDGNFDC